MGGLKTKKEKKKTEEELAGKERKGWQSLVWLVENFFFFLVRKPILLISPVEWNETMIEPCLWQIPRDCLHMDKSLLT